MTTTDKFQKLPDYYKTKEEAEKAFYDKKQTNPVYKGFTQVHFTAGDVSQFEQYRDSSNGIITPQDISLHSNVFKDIDLSRHVKWDKYSNLNATSVDNTFNYIYNKFKKGIFIKIKNGALDVFLPFSNSSYINEWGDRLKYDETRFKSMKDFLRHSSDHSGFKFNEYKVTTDTYKWGGNNCLVRYEYPLKEGDAGIVNMKDMFSELCKTRKVPDIEFFLNKRDFPILKRDGTEPYNHIYGSESFPLVSHNYDKYCPILGGAVTDKFADIPIPTWDDWQRVNPDKYFTKSARVEPIKQIPWENKKPTAVFRGGSTGCGTTIKDNNRLKVSHMYQTMLKNQTLIENGFPLLDAGITKWNNRPRKQENSQYLNIMEEAIREIPLMNFLDYQQQSEYKYVINIDGHVTAFRISMEMSFGSVILLTKSKYRIWFMDILQPYVHYVPVKEDLSDLIDQIRWCRNNDLKCKEIANNALEFYNVYLSKVGILDYLQKILIELKKVTGIYLYNYMTVKAMKNNAKTMVLFKRDSSMFPKTDKSVSHVSSYPQHHIKNFNLLKGIEWVFNFIKYTQDDYLYPYGMISDKHITEIAKFSVEYISWSSQHYKCEDEAINDAFIGLNCVNVLHKYCPNFEYTFGSLSKNGRIYNVKEHTGYKKHLFKDWINSPYFNIKSFLFILLQICYALNTAQRVSGFVHCLLTPDNIYMINQNTEIIFDYIVCDKKYGKNISRITTQHIPVIFNFIKSCGIYDREYYGDYKFSTSYDVITIVLSSLNCIINTTKVFNDEINQKLLNLANFVVYNKSNPVKFKKMSELKEYLKLIDFNLINDYNRSEEINPMDMIVFLEEMDDFKVSNENELLYNSMMFGNPRQVFDYCLSNNDTDRLNTYIELFTRVNKCVIPQPKNVFLLYYTAQQFDLQIRSNFTYMDKFMKIIKRDDTDKISSNTYKDVIELIYRIYKPLIHETVLLPLEYNLENVYDSFTKDSKYDYAYINDKDLLIPSLIKERVKKYKGIPKDDFSEYRLLIDMVLNMSGAFKMTDKHKDYYLKSFEPLLNLNPITLKIQSSIEKTVLNVVYNVYYSNMDTLKGLTTHKYILDYTKEYDEIIKIIKKL